MVNLLKHIGRGILYIIGLPFFLIVLALTAVAGIFIIVGMFIKSIFLFFTGRSLNDELPEDIKARKIKEARNNPQAQQTNPTPTVSTIPTQPTPTPVANPSPTNPEPVKSEPSIEDFVFDKQEKKVEEAPIIETIPSEEEKEEIIEEEPTPIQEIKVEEKPVEREIQIGEYKPNNTQKRFIEDYEEDDDDNSGITISYGGEDD